MSYTFTRSHTFTIAHARELASRVVSDMHLCRIFYGKPAAENIRAYAEELAQMLRGGWVSKYEFGFKKNETRMLVYRYEVDENGYLTRNDDPGGVDSSVDIDGAVFYTFLWTNGNWSSLSEEEQALVDLPFRRTEGDPPGDGLGFWTSDRNYHAGGRSLGRKSYKRLL